MNPELKHDLAGAIARRIGALIQENERLRIRVDELLRANNDELERRREAERRLEEVMGEK